jgi:hypothetical protein
MVQSSLASAAAATARSRRMSPTTGQRIVIWIQPRTLDCYLGSSELGTGGGRVRRVTGLLNSHSPKAPSKASGMSQTHMRMTACLLNTTLQS